MGRRWKIISATLRMSWKNRLRDSMLNWKLILVPKWNMRNTLSEQRKLMDWLKLSSRTDREAGKTCLSKEFSDALATIRELEDDIRILEEELDKQAHGFESDLEAVMRAKVDKSSEQSEPNSNTAGRLQAEFKRPSMQMQSTFEANERLATKAKTEASDLRLINKHLEDLLQQAKEELESVKDDYEAQVLDLHNQLSLKAKQIDQLLLDIEEKSNLFNYEDEVCQSFSVELLTLRAELDRLTSDTASFVPQMEQGTDLKAELEQLKMLVKEREFLAQREKSQRENLENHLIQQREMHRSCCRS